MVLPIVLASLALVGYFLTKPKKSDSDIYGKDSEPKKTTTKFDKFYDWVTNPENKKEYYDSPEIKNDKPKDKPKYEIKCDECKTKIGSTIYMVKSAQGGKCAKCKPKIKSESEINKIISDSKPAKKEIDYNNINVKKALKKQKTKAKVKSNSKESKEYQKRIQKSFEGMIR
tara:strand:+ start:51 stop:563 length:513 start_codon:yes stop_codon:yes gene_type:complete